ncbi:MAG: energy transducer TonB [Thalassotalea sp.]
MLTKLSISTAVIAALYTTAVYAEQSVKHISSYQSPEPTHRVAPKFPISAAKAGREGWTKMSFVVEEDGSVSNPIVIGSSGSADFDKASLKAIEQWQYTPAVENGKPIQQCINTVQLDYRMNAEGIGEKGITRKFKSKYNKAVEALTKKDYELVEEKLASMKKSKNMFLTESNLYHNLAASYAQATANKAKELYHLTQITTERNAFSPEKTYNILARIFMLQIQKNHLNRIVNTYNRIKKLDVAKPQLPKYEKIINQIDDIISGDTDIIVQGNINKRNFWTYPLVRNEFSITNIQGHLQKIDVRCANKHHIYTIEDNHTWSIPKAWKHCSVMIFGDKKSKFSLIEHPTHS